MRYPGNHRSHGFILPLALVFLFVLLLLEVSLYTLQQRAAEAAIEESSRLAQLLGTENLLARQADALNRGVPSSGDYSVSSDFEYTLPGTDLKLKASWSPSESFHLPTPSGWSTFEALLAGSQTVPSLSFDKEAGKELKSGQLLPPGHTFLSLDSSEGDHGSSVHSTSSLFPYGIYAPGGKIRAKSVGSFANAPYTDSAENDKKLSVSGRPVDILAGENVVVEESYRSGNALSVEGTVSLPENDLTRRNGAVPYSGQTVSHNFAQSYRTQLATLAENTLKPVALDKTRYFDTGLFEGSTLLNILKGDVGAFTQVFSVGQACKVPFVPIPGMQDDILLDVFYVWHPWPVDFSGESGEEKEISDELKDATQQLQDARKVVDDLKKQLNEEEGKDKPDQDKIQDLNRQLDEAQDKVKQLEGRVKKLNKKLDEHKKDVAGKIARSSVPETAAEDRAQRTIGWSYFYVLGELFHIVEAIITGGNPFEAIEARVVHLGDRGPDWSWEGGNLDMVGTLTVPRGRTLRLTKPNLEIEGDVYLHPGALLVVDGNLTITPPDDWSDFDDVEKSDRENSATFPNGRLIMEEGSNLVVSGNLNIEGGTVQEGSVLLVSDYGPNRGLTRMISAGGSIKLNYGTAPGIEFGRLVDKLSENRPALHGFFEEFFNPLTETIAPQIAKVAMVGPWQTRSCWFAEYATTFEFIPWLEEFFGLGGPWPIPLPYPNCLREVFDYISLAYSAELNFAIGENLYTHSPFWAVFGRGVAPVSLKVRADLVSDAVGDIKWGQLFWSDFKDVAYKFLSEALPELAKAIVEDVFVKIMATIIKEAIPFEPVYCGDPPEGGPEKEAETVKDAILEVLKEKMKLLPGTTVRSLFSMLVMVKNQAFDTIDEADPTSAVLRELPGVCVVSGQNIVVGEAEGSRLATGLFIADRDITIDSEYTVGCVMSSNGDVTVETLLHYPYFDRISLYKPKSFGTVLVASLALEDPRGELGGDVAKVFPRRLAEGWKGF